MYSPKDPTTVTTLDELRDWVSDELGFVAQEFGSTTLHWLNPVHRAPDKPREGMIIYADGTDFDPGGGKGIYEYDGTSWVRYGAYPGVTFSAWKNNVDQSIPSGVSTKLTFGTEHYDVGGYYDAANSRFTPPAGRYRICAQAALDNTTGLGIQIYVNGSYFRGFWSPAVPAGNNVYGAINTTLSLNGTDYVEIFAFNYDAVNRNISGQTDTWFQAEKVT